MSLHVWVFLGVGVGFAVDVYVCICVDVHVLSMSTCFHLYLFFLFVGVSLLLVYVSMPVRCTSGGGAIQIHRFVCRVVFATGAWCVWLRKVRRLMDESWRLLR